MVDMGCDERVIKLALQEHYNRLENPSYRVPLDNVSNMYERSAKALNDPLLGAKLGYRVSTMQLGLLGNLLVTAATLGVAITTLIHFSRLVSEVFDCELIENEDMSELVFKPSEGSNSTHHQADAMVATIITLFDKLIPERVCWVEFMHDDMGLIKEYESIYRCPVIFHKDVNKVVFPTEYLQVRAGWFDEELFDYQINKAQSAIMTLESQQSLVQQVESFIKARLNESEPTIQQLAIHLKMGERTLQSKLKNENTSFRKILNGVREAEAKSLLIAGFHTNNQIAMRIGFNDVRNFYAAFKRWTGMTPQEYVRAQCTG